ncbi:MAG: response regulator [Alphaproteobacteria bacterium]
MIMPTGAQPMVLIIDDDPMVRDTIADVLGDMGCEVLVAPNGEVGLFMFKQREFDLVVTDLIMPVKEGVETIVEILQIKPTTPILAISGGGRSRQLGFLNIARKFGAAEILSKPIDIDELSAVVTRLLGNGGSG